MKNVVAVVLAGGKGSRLEPLTRDRAKPAVPFGGAYRIIDFALSNCLNSGIRKMLLLTQYKAMSLDRHINRGWRNYVCSELGEFIDIVPPQQRIDENWYQGTADAVYQNIYALEQQRPEFVVILAGDHVYKMNYREMLEYHINQQADLTIGALKVTPSEARGFGVMQVDETRRLSGFQEKPESPRTLPGDPGCCLASMGIYIFSARVLFELLCQDANLPHSSHDFGRDIIPSIINSHKVVAWPFADPRREQPAYWRDVGTLDAYYQANMDLIVVRPDLNLYDSQWPIRTCLVNAPPPRFVSGSQRSAESASQTPPGCAVDSIVCPGTIVSGAVVRRSIVGCGVRLLEGAAVSDSILFDGVKVGKAATIRRAIIDKDVEIPDHAEIGVHPERDRERGLTVTDGGVVVIAKGDRILPVRQAGSQAGDPGIGQRWHVKPRIAYDR